MRKLNNHEMKHIKGGCVNAACECIDAFISEGGWSFEEAYHFCVHVLEFDPRENKDN